MSECAACGRSPCASPSFCRACIEQDRTAARRPKPDHNLPENWVRMPFGALWELLNDPGRFPKTAASVLDAAAWLWFQVGDPKAFEAWLRRYSPADRAHILDHIQKIAKDKRDAENQR